MKCATCFFDDLLYNYKYFKVFFSLVSTDGRCFAVTNKVSFEKTAQNISEQLN